MTNFNDEEMLQLSCNNKLKEVYNLSSHNMLSIGDACNPNFQDRLELIKTLISENREDSNSFLKNKYYPDKILGINNGRGKDSSLAIKKENLFQHIERSKESTNCLNYGT